MGTSTTTAGTLPDAAQTHTAITKGGLEQTVSFRTPAGTTPATVRNALGRLLRSQL